MECSLLTSSLLTSSLSISSLPISRHVNSRRYYQLVAWSQNTVFERQYRCSRYREPVQVIINRRLQMVIGVESSK